MADFSITWFEHQANRAYNISCYSYIQHTDQKGISKSHLTDKLDTVKTYRRINYLTFYRGSAVRIATGYGWVTEEKGYESR
jgi:hypothetical protein